MWGGAEQLALLLRRRLGTRRGLQLRDIGVRALRLSALVVTLLVSFAACGKVRNARSDANAGSSGDSSDPSGAGEASAAGPGDEAGGSTAGHGAAGSGALA